MRHEQFHVFTIFKCHYNVGVTIIIYLFVKATMTSDIYARILSLIETMFFLENSGTWPAVENPASGQFPQLLRQYTQKSMETVDQIKISTSSNDKKF